MGSIEAFMNSVTNEQRAMFVYGFLSAALTSTILFIIYYLWSYWWLKRQLGLSIKAGATRREARARIRSMKPLPREVRLLIFMKYGRVDDYYRDNYLKEFSGQHFGTEPQNS